MKSLLILILFSFSAYAQIDPVQLVDFKGALDSINDQTLSVSCEKSKTLETEVAQKIVKCDSESPVVKKDDFTTFQVNNLEFKDLPEEIQKHIPGKVHETAKLSLAISLPNDNKLMGLWGVLFSGDGDDFGATHGTALNIRSTRNNGVTYTLNAETNLFTRELKKKFLVDEELISRSSKPSGSRVIFEQNFTNESLINLVVDNIQKDKVLFYKVGFGWIQLDSKNSNGLLRATGQQQDWHKFLDIYGFENTWDNRPVVSGFNVDAFLGIQKNLSLGSSCRVRAFAESGAHLSQLKDDYFKVEAGSVLYIQKPGSNFGLRTTASVDVKGHQEGVQKQTKLGVEATFNRFSTEFIFNKKYGDLRNHTNYNLPNEDGVIESTFSLKFKYIFGLSNLAKLNLKRKNK